MWILKFILILIIAGIGGVCPPLGLFLLCVTGLFDA